MTDKPKAWWVYLLECGDGSIYTGITTDVRHRIKTHRSGKGAKYVAAHRPLGRWVAWVLLVENRGHAEQVERSVKRWSHAKKAATVNDLFNRPDTDANVQSGCG